VFKHVMLTVGERNTAAAALYLKVGFRRIAGITGYFAPGTAPEPRAVADL
jgi:ribosomal protein S18 acetylase RimI-like enzyme